MRSRNHFDSAALARSTLLALSCALAACASSKAPEPAAPPAPAASSAAPAAVSSASSTNAAPSDNETSDAGADETPADCNFRVKGFCFKTDEEACAAAGCDQAHCMIQESHPAHVKCRE